MTSTVTGDTEVLDLILLCFEDVVLIKSIHV